MTFMETVTGIFWRKMDGNIFFVMGMAYKGLKQQGMKQPHLKKKEKIHQHVR